MAATVNLDIDQGAGLELTFAHCEGVPGNPEVAGTPIDVTGWSALLQIRTAPGSVVLLELTDAAGITVGTTDGTFTVSMTAAQTALLDQDCRYDLLITDSADPTHPIRLVEGTVIVDNAISVP